MNIPLTLTNLASFFKDWHLKYNDGRGTQDIVTFLGADFGKDMQIKCQINVQWFSHSCWSWDIELHWESWHCFNSTDIWGVLSRMREYWTFSIGTYSFTRKSFTTPGGNDESSLSFTAHTFSEVHHYDITRRNSKMSCSVERLLPNLCSMPIWSSSQVPMAIKI